MLILLSEKGAEAERVAERTAYLREELLGTDVEEVSAVPGADLPPGARAVDVAQIGSLLVGLDSSATALGQVVTVIRSWLGRCQDARPSLRLTLGDDTLVVHFSCHGLKSESGALYFAAGDTEPRLLDATAVPAQFVRGCMARTRAGSTVLFLDCCYGGAFSKGSSSVRASGDVDVLESFTAEKRPGGRGWAVITASNSMEYAFEGPDLAENAQPRPSVFTHAVVEGLRTGEADLDLDGVVSLDDLYDYVFDHVREQSPNQTPSKTVEMQGDLHLAYSKHRLIRFVPVDLPPSVRSALGSRNAFARLGAAAALGTAVASVITLVMAARAGGGGREGPGHRGARKRAPNPCGGRRDGPAARRLPDHLGCGAGPRRARPARTARAGRAPHRPVGGGRQRPDRHGEDAGGPGPDPGRAHRPRLSRGQRPVVTRPRGQRQAVTRPPRRRADGNPPASDMSGIIRPGPALADDGAGRRGGAGR